MERAGAHVTTAFQWSRGGWFGSQLGATLWPLLLGVAVFAHVKPLGSVLLGLALVPNLAGIAMWRQRRVLAPYPAIQALVALCAVCLLLSLVAVHLAGLPASSLGLPPAWLLLVYPGLMLVFHVREQRARRA